MLSLSLVQQGILSENWPFFRSGTNDHTTQCIIHGNAFYVNNYHCNRSCLGNLSGYLYPWLHSNSISHPETLPKLSQDVCLGERSGGTLTTSRYSFYLLSAASWEVYKVVLKLVRQVLSCFLLIVYVRSFLCPVTLSKILHTKLWVRPVFGPGVKSPSDTMNPAVPFTISYQYALRAHKNLSYK